MAAFDLGKLECQISRIVKRVQQIRTAGIEKILIAPDLQPRRPHKLLVDVVRGTDPGQSRRVSKVEGNAELPAGHEQRLDGLVDFHSIVHRNVFVNTY